jgi:hypothetical protein
MSQILNPAPDRAWAAASTGLAGAVLAITSGVRTPGGFVAALAVFLLGALALLEARNSVAVRTWLRVVPYVTLAGAAALIVIARA